MTAREAADRTRRRRRADAERSVERILAAAVDALAEDPDASMSAIARRAGVVRATVYVHYPAREDLLAAVADHAIHEVTAVIDDAEPERGEPADALRRVVAETWRTLGRYHALVAITTSTHSADQLHDRHAPVLNRLLPLIERGQAAGAFRSDLPPSWHLGMLLALIHAASAELTAGRISADGAEEAVVETVVGAITTRR
jgi:AcrR family transcriptional regulator